MFTTPACGHSSGHVRVRTTAAAAYLRELSALRYFVGRLIQTVRAPDNLPTIARPHSWADLCRVLCTTEFPHSTEWSAGAGNPQQIVRAGNSKQLSSREFCGASVKRRGPSRPAASDLLLTSDL